MTHRIGFLIPEFPGQTHAFFIRERSELKKRGIETKLISTRAPIAGAGVANHHWAKAAAEETTYLAPMSVSELLVAVLVLLVSGPRSWIACLGAILGKSDVSPGERVKLFALMLAGAHLKKLCIQEKLPHVHVHSCANAANVAMFAQLLGGASYSITLHGPLKDYGPHQAYKWKYAVFAIVITQELVEEVQQTLEAEVLPPILLAPMGVNVEAFKRTGTYSPANPSGPIRLVSCGRLNPAKGHDDLIKALQVLRARGLDVSLNICGSSDSNSDKGNYVDELHALSEELELVPYVNLLGSVSEERVRTELEQAHFFCLASHKEPLGVATMEAMSMETPAIVTRSPGVSEMVDSGVDGVLVEPKSPDQFVDAIVDLIDHPDKAKSLAVNGRKKVCASFHSGVSAGRIIEGLELIDT